MTPVPCVRKGKEMALQSDYGRIDPYTTKDGSQIRELMHPRVHGNTHQSLAEATVPGGEETFQHRHARAEELYYITEGEGIMFLGKETLQVLPGRTVCIPPGTPHKIRNVGRIPLRFLCCSSPAYSHEDTELLP